MVHGVTSMNGRGISYCILQDKVTMKHYLLRVRVIVKSSTVINYPDCFGMVYVSLYDIKSVFLIKCMQRYQMD